MHAVDDIAYSLSLAQCHRLAVAHPNNNKLSLYKRAFNFGMKTPIESGLSITYGLGIRKAWTKALLASLKPKRNIAASNW
jgi:hypothetical protein